MKTIISLFISAYQPTMASIECRCRDGQAFDTQGFDDLGLDAHGFDHQAFEKPHYDEVCWMISRARRRQPLGYCVMYLRYVGYHSGYVKTVAERVQRYMALHPNLETPLSTSLITWLQQHEDLFCHTLQQQLIEFHTSR